MGGPSPVLVTGAGGYTGRRLVQRLVGSGAAVRALVRPQSDVSMLPDGVQIVRADLEDGALLAPACHGVQCVYHLAHVRHTGNLVRALPSNLAHLVVVSSLRALSRVPSESVQQVLLGEATLDACPVPWTILRPSMIFGDGDDRNISRVVARVRAGAWLPAIGRRCLHQPVFVEDVIDAILACQHVPSAAGRTYAIAGAEPLSWEELVGVIGQMVGRSPRWLPVPARLAVPLLAVLQRTGVRLPLQPEQVLRMLEDKAFDIEPARGDLNYQPLVFADGLQRALQQDAA